MGIKGFKEVFCFQNICNMILKLHSFVSYCSLINFLSLALENSFWSYGYTIAFSRSERTSQAH